MKIFTATILIGILSSTTSGSYVSSKDTRCRSECRRDSHCPQGFMCKDIPRVGCRLVYECVKAFHSPIVVDPFIPIGGLREQTVNGDLQIVNLGGDRVIKDVFQSTGGRGRAGVVNLPVGSGVRGVGVSQHVLPPVLVPNDVGPLRGDVYTTGDVKLIDQEGLIKKPISAVDASRNPLLPVDKLPITDPTAEVQRFAMGLCIDNCLMGTTCLQGTPACRLACQNFCLNEQSTLGVGPIVDPLGAVLSIDKPSIPVDQKVVIKPKSTVKNVKSLSTNGGLVHGSGFKGPIHQINSQSFGFEDVQGLVPVSNVVVDPFTAQIVSPVNHDGTLVDQSGPLAAIDAKISGGHDIVKPILPGGTTHDFGHVDAFVKPIDAFPSSEIHGKGGNLPINKVVVDSLTGLKGNLGDSIINQQGLQLKEKVIINAKAHIGHSRAALEDVDGNLHQVHVSPVKSKGLGPKTVIVNPIAPVKTNIGVRQVVEQGGFINAQEPHGHELLDTSLTSQNVPFVKPVLQKIPEAIEGSTVLVNDLGQTHLVDSGVKAVQGPLGLDILIPTNPRDCFKECNRDGQCGDYEHGICRTVGCKRVCDYPVGSISKKDRRY